MKTITITEAKRRLGEYLQRAAAGEDIGIVSGADIISLRKVEVVAADQASSLRVAEAPPANDWPDFPTFDGGAIDAALHHDKYLYDDVRKGTVPARKRQK
ncbi:MAG TPA: type II toxin-antitoxin system prevent-host-death family antitoxin [Chthoniobacter sp.]|jgi:antitoxin (DNA-binding transcriptional repressor) of toxin-antitoxin stability system